MTSRANCRAIYDGRLDYTAQFNSPDISGPEDTNPNVNDFNQQPDRCRDDEPHHMDVDTDDRVSDANMPNTEETPSQTQQDGAPFVELFPFGAAGTPISNVESVPGYQALQDELGPDNTWYPFQSQHDWDFARWAKTWGPSSTAVTELLAIDGVVENLGLSLLRCD
ncbi:hypothetical protein EDB92DRAFT_1948791 [Lactarius akahatsu]|uniref:Uncharacterized protein n=1 Tax=Lactarius akahatsu TaxID=416441 RepID=A0AAD4QBI1_9AGAM|nr:hypothetical protein EDB92DRAFT_1948791 [Lactarius akahatsu]